MQFVPLPEELQNYTGFVAGIPADTKPSAAIGRLITFLKSPAAAAVLEAKGMKVDLAPGQDRQATRRVP